MRDLLLHHIKESQRKWDSDDQHFKELQTALREIDSKISNLEHFKATTITAARWVSATVSAVVFVMLKALDYLFHK